MDINKLLEISSELGFSDISDELKKIQQREATSNCPLILPLVGEFSSGKTTLINALTDSKKLETATMPTTATIYEVHFCAESCHASIMSEDGAICEVDNLDGLQNEVLKDAKVVTVFDTSTKVPPTTILVDTPGLSSPDPKHKQTLVDFLPNADAILLVSDVNQQITRSLTDFIKTISLSKRPIYLVLTKCDTKSPSELDKVKKYISENVQLKCEHITCVSANTNDLDELYSLFKKIELDKSDILKKVNSQRVKNIINLLIEKIDDLLASTKQDTNIDDAVRQKRYELDKLYRNIDSLLNSMSDDISVKGKDASRKFEDVIFDRLDSLVAGNSNNFDAEAVSAINNTSSLILNEFKTDIQSILKKKAQERIGTDEAVNLHSLSDINLNQYSIEGISYNLNLNSMGHEYDGYIATGVKIAGAAAAVAAVAVAAPAVVGAGGAAAAGEAGAAVVGEAGVATAIGEAGAATVTVQTIADVADTVTDIGSIISNRKTTQRIQQAVGFAGQASEQYANIQNLNQSIGQQVGSSKGIVESMVGFVTDRTMGKPQRRRAIHDYMDNTLLPEFRSEISRITNSLCGLIGEALRNEASNTVTEMTNALEELKRIKSEKKEEYARRISLLRDYKNTLQLL